MRILVDMPEQQVKDLTRISVATNRPRAALIREAISAYLARSKTADLDSAFGLWGDHQIDGLEYQQKLRAEW